MIDTEQPGTTARRRLAGRDGIVVLGPLIGIVVFLTALVLIGLVLDRMRQGPPPAPVARELRYAAAPLEVRFGALTTRRLRSGDRVWVLPSDSDEVAVLEDARSNRIVGFVSAGDLVREPPATRPPAAAGATGRR